QRPGGTPLQGQATQQPPPTHAYPPPSYPNPTPSAGPSVYPIPQPSNSGSLDLSNIKPTNSGSVSLADAVARARGIAAEKGVHYSRCPVEAATAVLVLAQGLHLELGEIAIEIITILTETNAATTLDVITWEAIHGRGYGIPGDRSPLERRGGDEGHETITIESSLVGLIIGRSGENLRRVENETGSRVQFVTGPEASGPIRQCKITGSRAAREDAKSEIYRIIAENGKETGSKAVQDRSGSLAIKGAGSHAPALRAGEDATQIMVPNRTVGLIIGRGGETIRDLQERSGCHVNIVGEEKSVNGLRPVNLIGTPQAAATAKELIMEIVDSDTKNLTSQGTTRDTVRGTGTTGVDNGEKINDVIVVRSEAVGMIIGKGGETIKEMQNVTGCKINVTPASGRDIEREIGLVGSRGAIDAAKRAIMDKVQAVVSVPFFMHHARNGKLTLSKEEKNRSGAGQRDQRDQRDDRYSGRNDQYAQNQQPYGQQQNMQPQAQPGGDAVDPYAPYGGYQNYLALWYSSLQTQGQQQQQQQAGEQHPPSS
ncbi:MAG: hypothetical protein Q9214_005560, partial [Letrouitia sp. 1 TL-2023]